MIGRRQQALALLLVVWAPALGAQDSEGSSSLRPGNSAIVISIPHGGRLAPAHVADRREGVLGEDANTADLGERLCQSIHKATGLEPALILCHWQRRKVDMNREVKEAAQGDPHAQAAWQRYHQSVHNALQEAIQRHGRALLIDLHGQSHPQQRVELGYLHDASEYAAVPAIAAGSAALLTALHPNLDYDAFLHGPLSFGASLEARGFPATPSPREPRPSLPYFRGGYTLRRHATAGAMVLGIQIEANRNRLRDTPESRQRFADAATQSLLEFLPRWLKLPLKQP